MSISSTTELGKVLTWDKVAATCAKFRRGGQRIVFTNGVFDILHRGHADYLAKARKLGDMLIVGLNSDKSVRRLKGPTRPIQKQADRAFLLSSLRAVDYVVIFDDDTPEKLIRTIQPHILAKGADYKIREIVGAEFVHKSGGKVVRVRLVKGKSTSSILAKFKS